MWAYLLGYFCKLLKFRQRRKLAALWEIHPIHCLFCIHDIYLQNCLGKVILNSGFTLHLSITLESLELYTLDLSLALKFFQEFCALYSSALYSSALNSSIAHKSENRIQMWTASDINYADKNAIIFFVFFCYLFIFLFLNTIFVSSHMYPENPEGTQVIVGSMNMGY